MSRREAPTEVHQEDSQEMDQEDPLVPVVVPERTPLVQKETDEKSDVLKRKTVIEFYSDSRVKSKIINEKRFLNNIENA